jgi:hypothetical protein
VSAILSLLGLRTRRDDEELAAQRRAWAGIFDLEHGRDGYHAYCLLEVREPVTARTPGELGAALSEMWAPGARQ